jgi:antitoxin YefM
VAIETTYTQLREKLASTLDVVVDQQEVVIVRRRGAKDVALIRADELTRLTETAHLLRSSKNAQRLLRSLLRVEKRKGKPQSVGQLRKESGLDHLPR